MKNVNVILNIYNNSVKFSFSVSRLLNIMKFNEKLFAGEVHYSRIPV